MTGVTAFQLLGKLAIDGVDETKKALDDVAKNGEDAKNKLSVSFQDIGTKAGELGKKMALGFAGIATGMIAGVEATREFRQDLGKLETSFSLLAEGGAEQGTKTFKELYAVLGEDDTAIEAANNLVALTGNSQHLGEWTNILTGVYASFGDSLPIEGLAEAANETARVGTVTGGLADALNWAGVSEDDFNAKLEKCNTTAEREKLIRETLTGLYGESAEVYKDVNSSVMANNTAQAEMNMKLADATAKIEPLITKGKLFIADVLEKLTPAITWIIDNMNILAPIILTFMGALFALNIASKIMAFIPILKLLFTTISTNPIVLVIGLIIGAIVLLIANWDTVKDVTVKVWESMKNAVKAGVDFVVKWFNKIVDFVKNNWQGLLLLLVNPFAGAFKLLYDNCEGFRKFVDNFVKNVKDFFVNGFNTIKNKVVSTVTNLVDGVKNKFNSFKNSVTSIFNTVKNAITSPIEKARDVVKGVVDKIKGFFKFNVSLPKIKLPHFGITPKGWQIGDLLKGKIPKLGIDWYAKAVRNPMILDRPTAFGLSPNGNIRVGGESGSELVGGTSTIMGMISNAVSSNNIGMENKLDVLISLLSNYLPTLSNQQVVLSTGELVGAMVNPMDKALGQLADSRRRGR